MSLDHWSDEPIRPDSAFNRKIATVRSTNTRLQSLGGPTRDWNSGVFRARTLISNHANTSGEYSPFLTNAQNYVATPRFEPNQERSASVTSSSSELDALSLFDLQTQAYNFRYMVKRLEQELVRAKFFDRAMALFVIRVDGIESMPNSLGQIQKDKALKSVAANLFKLVRPVDLIGRYSDDKFVVACPEMSHAEASALAKKISQQCSHTAEKQQREESDLSVSIGIAISSAEYSELALLLAVADVGADTVTLAGGNGQCFGADVI